MKFSLTFTQEQIAPAKKQALTHIASSVTLKGFRQGKAPLDLVEQTAGTEKVMEETVSHLIPEAYAAYIKDHNLKPIAQPRISVKKMVTDGDWEFDIEIAEKPQVDLGKYLEAVRGEKAKDTIWTPDKGMDQKDQKTDQNAESKKLTIIFDTLLKTCKLEVSDILIDEEVNRSLSRLLEQINKLGLTLEQYLASIGKKPEELRDEYKKTAADNLKLEFILDAIAQDQKVAVSEQEIEDVFKDADPKAVEEVKKRPMELASLKYSIVKHKVVDLLLAA
jgi:FKBP-type peptidyl-prolyl cis-trans isomerase (trigger factor)